MSISNTNEWYVFGGGSVDKKTCNKIRRWANKKWESSAVDTQKDTTDEERKTGKKGDYKPCLLYTSDAADE